MRFISVNQNNVVVSVRNGDFITSGEIESVNGELGQIMQTDGTFTTPILTPLPPEPVEPANSEIAQMISELQADLMIAGVI